MGADLDFCLRLEIVRINKEMDESTDEIPIRVRINLRLDR